MNYKGASDIQLWQCHLKGDIRAYNELFDRFAGPLYKQARRYINNDSDAEELVMDLLFNIWIKRDHLNPGAGQNLRAYLSKAMRHRILNHLKKSFNKNSTIDEAAIENLQDNKYADYLLITKDFQSLYDQSLKSLSPQRLKVFKMSREEGMSYAQIAKNLNLSINTVENYMVSALAILREKTKKWIILLIFSYLFLY